MTEPQEPAASGAEAKRSRAARRRAARAERAAQREARLRGRWDRPSGGAPRRWVWLAVASLAPVAVWAMLDVLAAGKVPDRFGLSHGVLLVVAVAVLGAFLWDSSDASRAKGWRSSWRSTPFRLATLRLFGRQEATRCTYCHDAIERAATDAATCPGCDAVFHTACRDELGGCPTLGCEEAPPPGKGPREKESA